MMLDEKNKKVAVVSGASRGLGQAITAQLKTQGYIVYGISSSGDDDTLQCDIRDEQQVERVITKIFEQEGRIDILINNAGVGSFALLEEYTLYQYQQMFDVNVRGLFLLCKAVIPYMKQVADGIILNIASDVSRRTFPGGSLYVASKYAVQGLSGCLAQELRPHGIRVGTINPGMIDTWFAGSTQGAEGKELFLQVNQLAELVGFVVNAPRSVNFDEIVLHPMIQEYGLS
jgi:NADP-dependent 3-hydroxy acid dehydrogenase YdfG